MLNLNSFNWDFAEQALGSILGNRSIRVSDSGKQALICSEGDDKVLAILKVYNDKDISLHIRASVYPNMAGFIASVISKVAVIVLDDVWEYDINGDMLVGVEAMDYAANNIHDLWFGYKDKKVGTKNDRPKNLN